MADRHWGRRGQKGLGRGGVQDLDKIHASIAKLSFSQPQLGVATQSIAPKHTPQTADSFGLPLLGSGAGQP